MMMSLLSEQRHCSLVSLLPLLLLFDSLQRAEQKKGFRWTGL